VEFQTMATLHELPAQLREVAEHPHAGGVFGTLALELAKLRREARLRFHEVADPFRFARRLSIKHLPGEAEEAPFRESLEGGFQRDNHPCAPVASCVVGTEGGRSRRRYEGEGDGGLERRSRATTRGVSDKLDMVVRYHETRAFATAARANRCIVPEAYRRGEIAGSWVRGKPGVLASVMRAASCRVPLYGLDVRNIVDVLRESGYQAMVE